MKSLLFILAAFVAATQAPASKEVPVAQEPSHHLVLENQYTRTYQVEVPPGKATLLHRHDHDYIFVVLGDAHISNEVLGQPPRDQQVKDGDVNAARGGFAHVARNLGTTPFRNVTIELLRDNRKNPCGRVGPNGTSGAELVCDFASVEREQIAPGAALAEHRHDRNHLVVALNELHLKNEVVGKGSSDIVQKPGDVLWVEGGFEHTLTNLGKEPARFIVVEFHY